MVEVVEKIELLLIITSTCRPKLMTHNINEGVLESVFTREERRGLMTFYRKSVFLFENQGKLSFINLQIHVTKCNRFQHLLVGSKCKRPVYDCPSHNGQSIFHHDQPYRPRFRNH